MTDEENSMKRKIKTGYNINSTDFTITYNYEEFEYGYFLNEECKKLAMKHTMELIMKSTMVDFEVARFLQENPLYKIKI